jgi:hypothetical protein
LEFAVVSVEERALDIHAGSVGESSLVETSGVEGNNLLFTGISLVKLSRLFIIC